ncbi:class I SAM-dependent methyltransferase [Paenibacillus lignilyticus]|uniref:Class I SAM-dependent methyltransferase n=1 Tax=Paenibacillus lignilyticus TaxID=1172615 RepID=A0ABS5C7M1_9BACL|nr:class I SAM-dependent methyltransferase [Paenibacillus lignilyticus]MBP3961123.1 class I SAM-dependent methyltransferase [Paenibacillus lignilyticus]
MPDHDHIYQSEAERYDQLISFEDVQHNLLKTINRIVPHLSEAAILDIGAGTGRLTTMLAPLAASITATDASGAMLEVASSKLSALGLTNWQTAVAQHDQLPLQDNSVDLVTAGWTICYAASSNVEGWSGNLSAIMEEIRRILKPGGTCIIFENFGTGSSVPNPPDFLRAYYAALVNEYGFEHEAIRTDYLFDSVADAVSITDFFFGDWLSAQVQANNSPSVEEWTGVWWKRFD